MTYAALKEKLTDTALFTDAEVHKIARTVGTYTVGNAIVACEILQIELSGNDIDEMVAVFEEGEGTGK